MAATVKRIDETSLVLTCNVTPEVFAEAMAKAYKAMAGRFSVPGFRKGKAPMKVALNYYGEGVLYERALDEVVHPALEAALKEEQLEPFSTPEIDVESIGLKEGVVFTASFAVRPEVELKKTEGLVAYRPSDVVEEKAVDQEIEHARIRSARLLPVDRPVEDGDTVTIDYCGKKDGVAFEGGTAKGHDLLIGSGHFIPGFEEKLIGHSKGESFTIDLTFPEDYHSEDLKGQAVQFEIDLKEVRRRDLPALDDEFAKDMSEEAETFAEYKAEVRANLEKAQKERNDEFFKENVLKALAEANPVQLPAAAVEDRMNELLRRQADQMSQYGIKFEDYLRMMNVDFKTFREQFRDQASLQLTNDLLLDRIAETEKIEITEAQIEEKLEFFAQHFHRQLDELKAMAANEEWKKGLVEDMKREKAIDWLVERAVATDVQPEQPKLEEEAAEAAPAKKTRAKKAAAPKEEGAEKEKKASRSKAKTAQDDTEPKKTKKTDKA